MLSPPGGRRVARLALAIAVVFAASSALAPVHAETGEAANTIEAWFARSKPTPPQVEIPGQGPVSPGDAVPAPQADPGNFAVSSGGGPAGEEDGDLAWAAFQWDTIDATGGTVEKFVVTFTQAPAERPRDFGDAAEQIRACNIVEPFGGAPEANPWEDRPEVDCATAVAPEVDPDAEAGPTFTFDLTEMAATWIDGTGYGVAIVPGQADDDEAQLTPFQITFAGYGTPAENADEVRPKATFTYQPGAGGDLDAAPGGGFDDAPAGDLGGGDLGGGGEFSGDSGIDVFPDDVGSAPPEAPAADGPADSGGEVAAPTGAQPRTTPTSSNPGFPAAGWLLLPLAALAFWVTGTALGPAGEPTALAQERRVSRVLAERRAARAAGDLPPIEIEKG